MQCRLVSRQSHDQSLLHLPTMCQPSARYIVFGMSQAHRRSSVAVGSRSFVRSQARLMWPMLHSLCFLCCRRYLSSEAGERNSIDAECIRQVHENMSP